MTVKRDFILFLALFGKDVSSRGGYLGDSGSIFSGQLSGRRDYPEVQVAINVEPSFKVDFKQRSDTRTGLPSFSRNPLCSLADTFYLKAVIDTAINIDSYDARLL